MIMKQALEMADLLGLTEKELENGIAHFQKTGQVLNRAVAIAVGLTDD